MKTFVYDVGISFKVIIEANNEEEARDKVHRMDIGELADNSKDYVWQYVELYPCHK